MRSPSYSTESSVGGSISIATPEDLDLLLSSSADETAKVRALDRVAESDDPQVLQVLLTMAQDTTLVEELGKAVGTAIARVFWRRDRVSDAPLYLFTGPVGEAFDKTVGNFQRRAVRRD